MLKELKNRAMEDGLITLSQLNDFVFCPISIYFHNLYGNVTSRNYQRVDQIRGKVAHEAIDENRYSTRKDVLSGIDVYSEKYGLIGKIDLFDVTSGVLTERKRQIKKVYDGYIFQLYGQYFSLLEMGYTVKTIRLHSILDNRVFPVDLPGDNESKLLEFETLIKCMRRFDPELYQQTNIEKCRGCIYEPACDRSYDVIET